MTQPGWYPDPDARNAGNERYWDGQQWTNAARPIGPMPPQSAPTKPKRRLRNTVLGLIAIVVLLIGIQMVEGSDGSNSSTNTAASPTESAEDQAARLDRTTYAALTERDYAVLVKDPDAASGRKIVVYGAVTQFDAATGSAGFRADTGAIAQQDRYGYNQNTVIELADPAIAANVVEGDLVAMYVEVKGSTTYDTQIGGSTTVPTLTANVIDVTGSS